MPLGYFTPNSGVGDVDCYEAWKLHQETAADDPVCQHSRCTALTAGAASDNIGTSNWPDEQSTLAAQGLGDYDQQTAAPSPER